MASVQYLKDLRQQCKERGLDSGLKATDLILIYFPDQNSGACERLFTERFADLLDTCVPGSQGTSVYVRSMFHLIEPFRKPNFGSLSDVQQSVSCGITILRLWRKVVELQKFRLHSKPGTKKTLENRGNFVTRDVISQPKSYLLLPPCTNLPCLFISPTRLERGLHLTIRERKQPRG